MIDEADLVLSYGYEEDLQSIAAALPNGIQTILMSATLRTEVDSLTSLFCKSGAPEILDLSEQEATEKQQLSQYIVKSAEQDKFLLTYAIFKLQLIKGKVIVFVADIDRCYRLKLFLEQFGIRSCVLNSELPVNSRLHTVDEFNSGVYDIIIAADEHEVVGGQEKKRKSKKVEEVAEDEEDEKPPVPPKHPARRHAPDRGGDERPALDHADDRAVGTNLPEPSRDPGCPAVPLDQRSPYDRRPCRSDRDGGRG